MAGCPIVKANPIEIISASKAQHKSSAQSHSGSSGNGMSLSDLMSFDKVILDDRLSLSDMPCKCAVKQQKSLEKKM